MRTSPIGSRSGQSMPPHRGRLGGLGLGLALGVAAIHLASTVTAAPSAPTLPLTTPVVAIPSEDRGQRVDRNKEYTVKAGILANFIKYTKWPSGSLGSQAPLPILVIGDNPYASVIERTLDGRSVGGRKLDVALTARVPDKIGAGVVFVSDLAPRDVARVLRMCAGQPVLLVGEHDGFAATGAGLNLYLDRGKVRFEANPEALRNAHLQVSSELLKLARIVKERGK